MDNPILIDIHGSCVSRDVFNYDNFYFKVGTYIFRNSIVSCMSEPCEYIQEDAALFKTVDGAIIADNFFTRMLNYDLSKSALNHLGRADWLVLDLHDMACALVFYGKSIFTYCTEFMESKFYKSIEGLYRLVNTYDLDESLLETIITSYAEKIKKLYPAGHILLLKLRFAERYKQKSGKIVVYDSVTLDYYKLINKCISFAETLLIRLLEPIVISVYNDDEYIADESHSLGLYGVHYEPIYCTKALALLKEHIT